VVANLQLLLSAAGSVHDYQTRGYLVIEDAEVRPQILDDVTFT
jgi:hypothetical protein